MDLNKIVNEQFASIVGNGYIEELVKKQLESTVESIVADLLRGYSDFGKEMKETIKSKLNINFRELDIPEYNTLVVDTLKEHINGIMNGEALKDVMSKVDTLLVGDMKETKVSDIAIKFKETYQEEANDEGWEEFTCIVKKSDGSLNDYFYIYLDKEDDKDIYSCQYRIRVNKDGIWNASSNSSNSRHDKNDWEIGILDSFKEYIYSLYAHGTKIINDDDDIETYYDENDEEEY